MPPTRDSSDAPASREELRQRLRAKVRTARQQPSSSLCAAAPRPDMVSELLRHGIDDAHALQMATNIQHQPDVLTALKRAMRSSSASSSSSSSKARSSRVTTTPSADDDEAPPPAASGP